MKAHVILLAACFAASCDTLHADDHSGEQEPYAEHFPPPGSNQMLRAPRGGTEGARAIVFRVHAQDAEERILVDQ